MIVQSDHSPQPIELQNDPRDNSKIIGLFHENIVQKTVTHEEITSQIYEYEEYPLVFSNYPGLATDIAANFNNFLLQAKEQEKQNNFPIYQLNSNQTDINDTMEYISDLEYRQCLTELGIES